MTDVAHNGTALKGTVAVGALKLTANTLILKQMELGSTVENAGCSSTVELN
jgi:hypothetical protein